jgi:hypothetical protein
MPRRASPRRQTVVPAHGVLCAEARRIRWGAAERRTNGLLQCDGGWQTERSRTSLGEIPARDP